MLIILTGAGLGASTIVAGKLLLRCKVAFNDTAGNIALTLSSQTETAHYNPGTNIPQINADL